MQVAGAAPPPVPTPTPLDPLPTAAITPQVSVSLAKAASIPAQASVPEFAVDTDNTAQYTVTVTTSDLPGAGTDCTAYIAVFGNQGDTGKQLLEAAEGRFLRGSVQGCLVAAPNVDRMTHICIGHNDDGMVLCCTLDWHLMGT